MSLNFEVVKTRNRNTVVEKYDFPVLVVNQRTSIVGGVQKFELNKAAVQQFGLNNEYESFVGLAFNADNKLVLVNLEDQQAKIMAKVNKDYSFNSSRIYNLLAKQFELLPSETYEFKLDITTDEDSMLKFGELSEITQAPNQRIAIIPSYEDEIKEEDMYYAEAEIMEDFNNL